MASIDQIRNNLIDKLISIKNKELLTAVDKLLGVSVKRRRHIRGFRGTKKSF